MKIYLNSNIVEGTPEELVTYQELLKERGLDSEKSLFHFGHVHQPTEDDKEEEEDSIYDKGAFYTVTEEASESPLPVGTILQHQYGRTFKDSQGQLYIISRPSFLERGSTHELDDSIKQDRFELAKELGIQLTSTTDFAVEASDRTFQPKEDEIDLTKGDFVKIVRDDNDRIPLVQSIEDSDKKDFVHISKLELVQDNLESILSSTDKEGFDVGNYSILSPEAQAPFTDIQVGDRVKVLKSQNGAEGEATVTAILEDGDVRLEGKSDNGVYSYKWSNHVSNLEKIEEDKLMGYTFWYLDDVNFNKFAVLKTSLEGYFETSLGERYTHNAVSDLIKPIDREDVREKFDDAENRGTLLSYYPTTDVFMNSH